MLAKGHNKEVRGPEIDGPGPRTRGNLIVIDVTGVPSAVLTASGDRVHLPPCRVPAPAPDGTELNVNTRASRNHVYVVFQDP